MSRPRRGGTDNPQRFDMFYHSRGGEFYINCLQGITGEFDISVPWVGKLTFFFRKMSNSLGPARPPTLGLDIHRCIKTRYKVNHFGTIVFNKLWSLFKV